MQCNATNAADVVDATVKTWWSVDWSCRCVGYVSCVATDKKCTCVRLQEVCDCVVLLQSHELFTWAAASALWWHANARRDAGVTASIIAVLQRLQLLLQLQVHHYNYD